MTETEQKNRESLHEIADEYSRSVFTMFEQRDYVLPSLFRGLIAADMRLLAEHVAKRQKEIESVGNAIDSGIQGGLERRLAKLEDGIRALAVKFDRAAGAYRKEGLNGQAELWDMAADKARALLDGE